MIQKYLICPEKVRRVPEQFSWIDHRLIRNHYIEKVSHRALALYLFLVAVGDQQGLSFYSDRSLGSYLSMDLSSLTQARSELIRAQLVAYQKPLCQVLSLEPPKVARSNSDGPKAVGEILRQLAGGNYDQL